MTDSAVKAEKKYYPQMLLQECNYKPKKIKMENHINDDLGKGSSEESDNDSNDKQNLMMAKIMMNLTNNLLKAKKPKNRFNNNKSLIVYVNNALLGFYLFLSV